MGKQRTYLAGLMAGAGAIALYLGTVRQWMYTWGADDGEISAVLPGDEFVAAGTPTTTRALTIDAPVGMVWPWLAQIGEDRGGFYSYSWLERAAGADIHNANVIHPEWQDIRVGDTVWLARSYGGSGSPGRRSGRGQNRISCSCHQTTSAGATRREGLGRVEFSRSSAKRLDSPGDPRQLAGRSEMPPSTYPHFVMEQKMMRGLRDRAEQTRRDQTTAFIHKEWQSIQHDELGQPVETTGFAR